MENENILTKLESIAAQVTTLQDLISSAQPTFRSAELKDLFTALAKAQSEMPMAEMTSENPYFKTKYADLSQIVKASRPSLTKHSLVVIQQILTHTDGQNILHTILGHSSGQWIESRMRIVPPKNDIQTLGSYITYLKRYAYASLVGVVTSEEDDDGEIAMTQARQTIRQPQNKYLVKNDFNENRPD